MKISLQEIPIRDIVSGYIDNEEDGVFAYGGKLNVRPPYQREFIYGDKEREAVINTITNDFPLNVMYWSKNDDGTFEIIDGQQRTISICQFAHGDFPFDFKFFTNLSPEAKQKFLDYKLMIYVCEGTYDEKIKWFETINIAGKVLTKQELLNAVYSGPWVADAKKYFSKSGCAAYKIGKDLLNGTPIRQDYLETAIEWINEGGENWGYMAQHQHDPNASELWMYFTKVINWVNTLFPTKRSVMKGIEWGYIYNKYKDAPVDIPATEKTIQRLLKDDDVTNKKGIYWYVFDHQEKHLSIRAFTESQKETMYARQEGKCPICGEHFDISFMEADHITPWCEGGKTELDNGQMLCRECNRRKSSK